MLRTGLIALFLTISACSTKTVYRDVPIPVRVVEYVPVPVDQSLLQGFELVDSTAFRTNGDLLRGFIRANSVIRQCNADKTAIRELLQ